MSFSYVSKNSELNETNFIFCIFYSNPAFAPPWGALSGVTYVNEFLLTCCYGQVIKKKSIQKLKTVIFQSRSDILILRSTMNEISQANIGAYQISARLDDFCGSYLILQNFGWQAGWAGWAHPISKKFLAEKRMDII